MKSKQKTRSYYVGRVIYVLLTGLLAYTVYAQRDAVADAVRAARLAETSWLLASIAIFAVSVVLSAVMYLLLSANRLRFYRTVAVQTAGLFANKLLPAGTGALGVSFLYLRRNKFSRRDAGVIVAANNFLGLVGHLSLIILLMVLRPDIVSRINDGQYSRAVLLIAVVASVIAAVAALLLIPPSRHWLFGNLAELRRLVRRWRTLIAAVTVSMLLTGCYALSLLFVAWALGVDVNLGQAFVILTFSVLIASAVPTPGGIGSAEAGAYLGLKAFGVDGDLALTVAILYRFVTFWLPLAVGSIAFWAVTRRGYILKKL